MWRDVPRMSKVEDQAVVGMVRPGTRPRRQASLEQNDRGW